MNPGQNDTFESVTPRAESGSAAVEMDIRIDSESDVPIRQQLTEQIVFLIVTDRLKAGQKLPSVRELARRLKIHHNTVSECYQDLVGRRWLQRRRGSRLIVAAREVTALPETS